jgi:DNA-directed RNA polymerase specialized sigma24 family protein
MSNDSKIGDGDASYSEGSVARAIVDYQQGDADELGRMLAAYFDRLLTKARAKMVSFPHTDHEGLVQSALRTFLRGAKNGQFPDLKHGDQLRWLLETIMNRKVAHEIRDRTTEIAGGGRVQNEPTHGLDGEGHEPDPVEEAICQEWLEHMRKKCLLGEAQLIWQGYHYHEIAEHLGMTESKARRTITLVHKQTRIFFGLEKE